MRGRFRSSIGTVVLVLIAMTGAIAQVRPPTPIDDPILKPPVPRVVSTATANPTPLPAPLVMPSLPSRHRPIGKPVPGASTGNGGGMLDNLLGPKMPLSMLPPLPAKTDANTASKDGGRRRMSGTITSIMYSTQSGCSSTLGYIFNVGCTIRFQLAYCNQNNGNANCGANGTAAITSITRTDFFQDYYIDANTGTAQTIGAAYQPSALGASLPSDCATNASCTYGPFRTLTLNNPGTVVLATVDCGATAANCSTATAWVALVYLTVGSANGLITYSDSNRLNPATQFTIPTGVNTNTVYIKVDSAQYSDYYVVYIENTSTIASCTGTIGQTDSGPAAGLCNPVAATGTRALSSGPLNMQWTFGSGTLWTALTSGTYSLVAYDQTQNKRVAQTQIGLYSTAGAQVSSVPVAGNSSPAPAPAATAGTRFAFDNTTDQSDSGFTTTWTGLTNGHKYCVTFNDPNGRVYQDYTTPSEKFVCITQAGTTLSLGHGNINAESPVDFAPNTYTITLCDYNAPSGSSPCTVVATQSVQLLGYNALTEFTNAAGTSVTGTSLVVPKLGSTVAGLEFVNDGDTYYGDGNGDTLSALYYSTATGGATGNGSTLNLSCGASCTQTVTDSNGQDWYVYEQQHGSGANAYTTLTICPTAWGTSCTTNTGTQKLAMNGTIKIPNITFFPPPGASNCTGGNCQGPTSILPSDGLTWSAIGSSVSGNLTYFTNSNGSSYGGTGTFTHIGVTSGCGASCSAFSGTVTSPCTVTATGNAKKLQQGFYPNFQQGLYSVAEPFSPASGQGDVYCAKITNNSTTGTITGVAFQLPPGYGSGGYATTWSVDANSPTTWTQDNTSGLCPAAASFCIKPNGANAGVAIGASQIVYLDVQNLPPLSFSFADMSESVYNPVGYQLTADACCTQTIPVGSTAPTQSTVDALALGAYSLDSGYMTPLFNPTSEGTSTNNTVNVSLKNTSTSQDTNPDYVDAIVFEFAATGTLGVPSGLTSNWIYLGSNSPGVGGGSTIDYWFGLCNAQFSTGNGPQSSPTTANAKSLPAIGGAGCTAAQAQNALSPGSTFSFNATVQTGASAGTITATAYAHGANGNGWSKAHSFALTVTGVSATGGFSSAGTYGAPAAVASNTTPQVGPDTNTTFGNSFVYTITNTSGVGHNLNSAQILIPYQDSSGANGADSANFIWKITAAPTISGGSGYTNCGVTSFTNPTAGSTNGYVTIGNSGGTCTIAPNGHIDVSFPMQAPYKANDQYYFPACVNGTFTVATCGGVSANETWVGDSYIQTVLGASLVISVDAATNTHGTALSPICASCTYTPATNKIDFGSGLLAGSTTPGTDVALVDLWTNASSPIGWSVYVTQTATDAVAAAYLQTDVDNLPAGKSYQPVAGSTLDQTSYAAIPVTASYSLGLLLANSSAGTTSTRNPFEFSNNYRIVIPGAGADTGANVSTVTYTFISN